MPQRMYSPTLEWMENRSKTFIATMLVDLSGETMQRNKVRYNNAKLYRYTFLPTLPSQFFTSFSTLSTISSAFTACPKASTNSPSGSIKYTNIL